MMLQIALWLLSAVLVCWLLLDSILKIVRTLWEILLPIVDPKPIDLRTTFGEWAVVTGSTDGIGKAYATELAARHINVVLISRNLEKLEKTRNEILLIYPKVDVKIIAADFSKGKEIFRKLEKELKDIPVGILVNNVGMMYEYPMYLGEVPEDVLWDIININVGATTLMTRLLVGEMQKRKRGAIVNVSSGSEFQPMPLMTVYAATKVYIKSFSDALRAEYSQSGITVQHLTPFFVTTKMNAFSDRLQISNIIVPNATTYAKSAIATLGKMDSSAGYWSHGIQKLFAILPPMQMRIKVAQIITRTFRHDYFKQKRDS